MKIFLIRIQIRLYTFWFKLFPVFNKNEIKVLLKWANNREFTRFSFYMVEKTLVDVPKDKQFEFSDFMGDVLSNFYLINNSFTEDNIRQIVNQAYLHAESINSLYRKIQE